MRVSIRCFGFPLAWYRPAAQAAERAGLHGLWVPDHVVSMTTMAGGYPYSAHGQPSFEHHTPFADPMVMVGHLAAATSALHLGIGVFVLPLRHPLHAARAVMSVQQLSGGRLVLGVGVGWMREEFDAVGERFAGRGGRTEEAIAVMRRLWTGEPVRHEGRWFSFPELTVAPGAPAPPILIGGVSSAALDRAVRLGDGWYGPPGPVEQTAAHTDALDAALGRAGRDRGGFRIVARAPDAVPAVAGVLSLAALAVDEAVVNVPRSLPSPVAVTDWISETAGRLYSEGVLPANY